MRDSEYKVSISIDVSTPEGLAIVSQALELLNSEQARNASVKVDADITAKIRQPNKITHLAETLAELGATTPNPLPEQRLGNPTAEPVGTQNQSQPVSQQFMGVTPAVFETTTTTKELNNELKDNITPETVRVTIAKVMNTGKRKEVQSIIAKYAVGKPKLPNIPKEKYHELLYEVNNL